MQKGKTNQLHQLLAVEKDRKTLAGGIIAETKKTFTDKASHFDGLVKTYHPFDEDGDKVPPEIKNIVTTVADKLLYTSYAVMEAINVILSKEMTNSSGTANADLVVGKKNFGSFSATALLALETQLNGIREYYKYIPTLDPAVSWNESETDGRGIFETDEQVSYRTASIPKSVEISPATKEHKAQAQLMNVGVQVGKYLTVTKSGRVTPAAKSVLLKRIDLLIDGVKLARAKANQADVINVNIGESLFDFIHEQ